MRRLLERLVPVAVLVGFLTTAVAVNLLLTNAEQRGVRALEKSVEAQVVAVAATEGQRMDSSGSLVGTVLSNSEPFRMEVGSPEDGARLDDLLPEGTPLSGGFYLVNLDGVVTEGVGLDDAAIGQPFEWTGYDGPPSVPVVVLPLGKGLTTSEPAYVAVFPLRTKGGVQGSLVFETVVAPDSDLNKNVRKLVQGPTGESGEFLFYDRTGGVVASSDTSMVAEHLSDDRFLDLPAGFHRFDDQVAVLADVPKSPWRVAFRQSAEEFDGSLSRPLESVGRLLVLGLLLGGFLLMLILDRRLRAARAEQERLRELGEAQQEFISIVSHELRTPVAGVLGFLETSLDHWDQMADADRRAAVGRAAANARRLQAMTRDVLDTQSVEAGRLTHVPDRLDLRGEVEVAVAAVHDADPDRRVEVALPDEPVWVQADADRLQQVLNNLLDNARRNSPAMEPIEVQLHVEDGTAQVCVGDHGPGVDDDALERIFEKFVRGRGDNVTGTGLGLYISRQIIEAHDGRIWAENEPGRGATFRFTLPLDQPAGQGC
jgi:signal transduction histidine kinase